MLLSCRESLVCDTLGRRIAFLPSRVAGIAFQKASTSIAVHYYAALEEQTAITVLAGCSEQSFDEQ